MLYIERQHRVALPGLEAGVVALRGRVIDEIELKALVALFLDVRIFVEEALELGLVQLAVQLIESGLRTDGLLLAVRQTVVAVGGAEKQGVPLLLGRGLFVFFHGLIHL